MLKMSESLGQSLWPSKVRGDAFGKLMTDSVSEWKRVIRGNHMSEL